VTFKSINLFTGEPNTDESNLLYVAVTRAKHALQMTGTLRNLLKQAGVGHIASYFTRIRYV